jgi:hypothetical protein
MGQNSDVYMIVCSVKQCRTAAGNRKKRWFHDVVSVAKEKKQKKGGNTKPIEA